MGFVPFTRPGERHKNGHSRSEVKLGVMKDYSVLDYLKGLLLPWKYPRINIPPEMPQEHITPESVKPGPLSLEGRVPETEMLLDPDEGLTAVTGRKTNTAIAISISLPWAALTALLLALAAQISLEPGQERAWLPGVIVYLMAMQRAGFCNLSW